MQIISDECLFLVRHTYIYIYIDLVVHVVRSHFFPLKIIKYKPVAIL